MSVIKWTQFGGTFPRVPDRFTPQTNSTDNVQVDPRHLYLAPLVSTNDTALTIPTGTQSLFRWETNSAWLTHTADAYWVKPLLDDAFDRVIFTDPDQAGNAANPTSLVTDVGGPADHPSAGNPRYPDGPVWLKVGAPDEPPIATVSGAPVDPADTTLETRFYVTTMVNQYGNESAPSPISNEVEVLHGQLVTVAFPASPVGSGYHWFERRVYRTNTGASGGTVFQYVAQVALTETVAGGTVIGITSAHPPVVTTSSAHNFNTGMQVVFTGISGMTQVNGENFFINVLTTTTFELLGVSGIAAALSSVTLDDPILVTTASEHNFVDGQIVTFAGMSGAGPIELENGSPYKAAIVDTTNINLKDATSGAVINGRTGFADWAFQPIVSISKASPAVVTTLNAHSIGVGAKVIIEGITARDMSLDELDFYNSTDVAYHAVITSTGTAGATINLSGKDLTQSNAFAAPLVISSISKSNSAIVTTATPHGLSTFTSRRIIRTRNVFINPRTGGGPRRGEGEPGIGVVRQERYISVEQEPTKVYIVAGDMTELTSGMYRVAVLSSTTFSIGTDTTSGFTTYTTGGTVYPSVVYGLEIGGTVGFTPFSGSGGTVAQISGIGYPDTVLSSNLGEALPTINHDTPNDGLAGITMHPSGFLMAYYGNVLTFSIPGFPHAWPLGYKLKTKTPIIGIGIFGFTTLVTTQGHPYLCIGTDPSTMTLVELETDQSCVARRGIVDFGSMVVYPSPDGLISVSSQGVVNITEGMFDRDRWQLLSPSSIFAVNWEGIYLGIYNNGSVKGFMIDVNDPKQGVYWLDTATVSSISGMYQDLLDDQVFVAKGVDLHEWSAHASSVDSASITLAPQYTGKAVNMACLKVEANTAAFTAGVVVNIYADDDFGTPFATKTLTSNSAVRLPGDARAEKWEAVVTSSAFGAEIYEVTMATTMREMSQVV